MTTEYNLYIMYNMKTNHIQLAGTSTIGPKGQVVIPANVREKMGISPGDKLIALYIEDKKSIAFVTEAQVREIINQFDAHVSAFRDVINI